MVTVAAGGHAALLAALPNPLLAARAADVREIGRRAVAILAGRSFPTGEGDVVLIARELGASELTELRLGQSQIVGVALAAGAITSHAAIMAPGPRPPLGVFNGGHLLPPPEG